MKKENRKISFKKISLKWKFPRHVLELMKLEKIIDAFISVSKVVDGGAKNMRRNYLGKHLKHFLKLIFAPIILKPFFFFHTVYCNVAIDEEKENVLVNSSYI